MQASPFGSLPTEIKRISRKSGRDSSGKRAVFAALSAYIGEAFFFTRKC